MSTTEIYGIKSNGNVVAYESVQNSWLGECMFGIL